MLCRIMQPKSSVTGYKRTLPTQHVYLLSLQIMSSISQSKLGQLMFKTNKHKGPNSTLLYSHWLLGEGRLDTAQLSRISYYTIPYDTGQTRYLILYNMLLQFYLLIFSSLCVHSQYYLRDQVFFYIVYQGQPIYRCHAYILYFQTVFIGKLVLF